MRYFCRVLLMIVMITTIGCAGSSSVDESQESESPAPQETENVSPVALPEGFPADVAIYPGSAVAGVLGAGPEGFIVSLETDATLEEVTAFYKQQLADDGWTIAGAVETPESTTITASKEERGVLAGISRDNDATIISMNVPRAAPE